MIDVRNRLARAARRWAAAPSGSTPAQVADSTSSPPAGGAARPQTDSHEPAAAREAADALGVSYLDEIRGEDVDERFITEIPIGFARQYGLLGLNGGDGRAAVAMVDPRQADQLEAVGRRLGRPVRPVLAERECVRAAIEAAYGRQSVRVQTVVEKLDRGAVLAEIEGLGRGEDLLDSAHRAPVIKLVNMTLFEAVKQQASDVHIQPREDRLVVRMRMDGVLYDVFELPKAVQEEMVSRVKVMGHMDIAEKRLPQDGRATVRVGRRVIDLRIASLPTSFGERVVIRLLDKSARLYRLDELGMNAATLERFRRQLAVDHGLILVTGPTGSGKTTTLYSALMELNNLQSNTLTLEDPIEYQLPGISQTQVSTKKGMTFAGGLRSVLRQDPDIIMVGEIRDHETATMTIQSALTGHLVFSTLHTNDAASAIARLLDLGIEPYLIASSVVGILAQRLARRVCSQCGASHQLTERERAQLGLAEEGEGLCAGPGSAERASAGRTTASPPGSGPAVGPRRGVGCEHCRGTGYRGRVGLFELLSVDQAVRGTISRRATAAEIKAAAVHRGMSTLRDDGLNKVLGGWTTSDELLRVTTRAEE